MYPCCGGSTYPSDVLNPEETDDNVIVGCPGQKLHRHWSKLLQPWFRPILQTRLEERRRVGRREVRETGREKRRLEKGG